MCDRQSPGTTRCLRALRNWKVRKRPRAARLQIAAWGLAALASSAASSSSSLVARTGESFEFKPRPAGGDEMVAYVVDWGDGVVEASAHGMARHSPFMTKVWRSPGDYVITPRAVPLSGGVVALPATRLSVEGPERPPRVPLPARRFDHDPHPEDPFVPRRVVLAFDSIRAIEALHLHRVPGRPLPHRFSVEFSTDGGQVWYDVPSAVYRHIPDLPSTRTFLVPLRNISADAVRVTYDRGFGSGEDGGFGGIDALPGESLFEPGADPRIGADWNNMWLIFGTAANEVQHRFAPRWPTDRPDEGGLQLIGSTIWAHWNSMKIAWLDDPGTKAFLVDIWHRIPQDDRGLMGVSPAGFHHLGHSKHFVTPAIFICGVAHWTLTHRDPDLLRRTDHASGVSLWEKLRRALRYQMEDLGGVNGVLTILDPDHDGTIAGKSGNYWDGWRFGYRSAYDNIWFYLSLDWMARLEAAYGDPAAADKLRRLRPLVKTKFNELFWDEGRGRYIGCAARDGTRHDYGFTFVNLEAIAAGLAPRERAERILDWLDGRRIVAGDTSTGADIYHFRVAPRSNTLAAEAVTPSFWDDWTMKVGPGTIGEYGTQIQNGGHIFYVSHYDLMARLRTRGVGDAMRRMTVILDEFHRDQLRRKPGNRFGSTHVEGILREFPESGLVPLFFLSGILGLDPDEDGLRIDPMLPADWPSAGVAAYRYASRTYRIRAERGLAAPTVDGSTVRVPSDGSWLLSPDGSVSSRSRPTEGSRR